MHIINYFRTNESNEVQQVTRQFSKVLNFFTSPNTTYNRLKSKERDDNDTEHLDNVPIINTFKDSKYIIFLICSIS